MLTIAELQKEGGWLWAYCLGNCGYHRPLAIAPFRIRWGSDMSSDAIRRCVRCRKCGHKGVQLITPSWVNIKVGFETWPDGYGDLPVLELREPQFLGDGDA